MQTPWGEGDRTWTPAVDVSENKEGYVVTVELAGASKDDVTVECHDNVLTIKGEKKQEKKDRKHHRTECTYGSFVRSFTLPQSVNADGIHAKYHHGTLNLRIPKAEEVKPKQIEVKVD